MRQTGGLFQYFSDTMSSRDFHKPSFTSPGGVFVAHVREGYSDRERHIRTMLGDAGVPFEFMLDGDIADITPERRATYFSPDLSIPLPAQSCSLKHLLIYEEIVKRGLPGALVLEDDICLSSRFPEVFSRSMEELRDYEHPDGDPASPAVPIIISYEDTRLRFVERSRREKGRVLYTGDRDRMTGCYYINRAGAEAILRSVRTCGGLHSPIDLYHAWMLRRDELLYLWCHPTVATQGSHIGKFRSGINLDKTFLTERIWLLKRLYRRLLYNMR